MKGHRSIYLSLFDEPAVITAQIPFSERRGRSEELKNEQNEMIVCRYYYKVKVAFTEYDRAIDQLRHEVYLSNRTIINIINRDTAYLQMLKQAKPDKKWFQKKYPFMVWE